MELMIAEKVKKYRRERDMTQEALAQALGVAPQSVSKWECDEGYPDITLLPAIANFFEITVDELIGNDEISAKEDVQKNYFNVHGKLSPDENLALALKYHRKYPRNWHIATSLMHEIAKNHRDKLDEYRPLLNEIAERILKECTDSVMRRSAVKAMCTVCAEEEIEEWLKKDTRFWYNDRLDIYEERYHLLDDKDQYWMYRYAGNFVRAAVMVGRLVKHEKNYWGDAVGFSEWFENYVRILDGLTGRRTDDEIPDGWMADYAHAYRCLANAYCGRKDYGKGYEYLERALVLTERWAGIPDETPMSLGNPLFFGETKILKKKYGIELPNGKKFPHLLGIRVYMGDLAYCMTTDHAEWSWFDPIRKEEHYQQILARAKELTI
ncbi:MAG: helix-turn-helix transcriptional regulator [Clostridia bacterium]|nr:helix-turn-helix transcriptional regulator [Clostridia bacterium]